MPSFLELLVRRGEAGRAIRRGDGPTALALLDPNALGAADRDAPSAPRTLYLLGRAHEANGDPFEAAKWFRSAIGTATWLETAHLDLVRWLARCRAVGWPISARSPGVGATWRRLPRAHCTLFHQLEGSAAALGKRVEAARAKALARLGFPDPIRVQATKTVVFVFSSKERYRESGASPRSWSGGCSMGDELEDGRGSGIVVYEPSKDADGWLDDVLVHEWAHVLVDERLEGAPIPSWAAEGVASWTESEKERASLLDVPEGERTAATLPWNGFLTEWYDPRYRGENAASARSFYRQALLAFDAVARKKASAAAALTAAREMDETKDPFVALGFKDLQEFEKVVGEVLGGKK